jgi:signal transduction histidine kinase
LKKFLPKSLPGQLILLMGAALLVAQAVNFAVIFSGRQSLDAAISEGPAISRFVEAALQVEAEPELRVDDLPRLRGGRLRIQPASLVEIRGLSRDRALEERLSSELGRSGFAVTQVQAATFEDWSSSESRSGGDREGGDGRRRDNENAGLILSAQLFDGSWLNASLGVPRRDPKLFQRLAGPNLAFFVLVLGVMAFFALWITRPIRDLTLAARSFGGKRTAPVVTPRGPGDVRQAIVAFNEMNGRVSTLLDEKDRMLGAIGHDLRTPLASMRIRAETMMPEEERFALIAKIEEMTAILEDILVLARTGRAREELRQVDVGELVEVLVDEYRQRGMKVVFKGASGAVAEIQTNLLRRAVRNLIDNALAYAHDVSVGVSLGGDRRVTIEVLDNGPGIPEDRIADVLEPFSRLESSRSRATGGTGLGLAISKAIAEGHGGTLVLTNRPKGGLRATIVI